MSVYDRWVAHVDIVDVTFHAGAWTHVYLGQSYPYIPQEREFLG
jgi:hypothetical protein